MSGCIHLRRKASKGKSLALKSRRNTLSGMSLGDAGGSVAAQAGPALQVHHQQAQQPGRRSSPAGGRALMQRHILGALLLPGRHAWAYSQYMCAGSEQKHTTRRKVPELQG